MCADLCQWVPISLPTCNALGTWKLFLAKITSTKDKGRFPQKEATVPLKKLQYRTRGQDICSMGSLAKHHQVKRMTKCGRCPRQAIPDHPRVCALRLKHGNKSTCQPSLEHSRAGHREILHRMHLIVFFPRVYAEPWILTPSVMDWVLKPKLKPQPLTHIDMKSWLLLLALYLGSLAKCRACSTSSGATFAKKIANGCKKQ